MRTLDAKTANIQMSIKWSDFPENMQFSSKNHLEKGGYPPLQPLEIQEKSSLNAITHRAAKHIKIWRESNKNWARTSGIIIELFGTNLNQIVENPWIFVANPRSPTHLLSELIEIGWQVDNPPPFY